jgi:mannose/fructose/N-acetylgalactosamine-specific phosphotransferase system component IIC
VTPVQAAGVVLAGTFVGLDLASAPQAMFSRPLVAGLVGGALAGHPLPGLAVGALLELFAMDTLPVGASRNPDWGPGSVAVGAVAAAHTDGILASSLLGLVLVAVMSAWAGGFLTHAVRRANTASVDARRAALEAGDPSAIRALQLEGFLRDAARSMALTAITLGVADLVATLLALTWRGPQQVAVVALAATSVGVALSAGLRLSGAGRQRLWFAGGVGAGALAVGIWLW